MRPSCIPSFLGMEEDHREGKKRREATQLRVRKAPERHIA